MADVDYDQLALLASFLPAMLATAVFVIGVAFYCVLSRHLRQDRQQAEQQQQGTCEIGRNVFRE